MITVIPTATALSGCGRDMMLSLSPGRALSLEHDANLRANADVWRVSDDLWDRWEDVYDQFDRCARWAHLAGPGSWPDADMLPLGRVGIRAERGVDRDSLLTWDKQRTLMTGSGLAMRLHGAGDLRCTTEPRPTPADGMSLVRVTAVGLCGSDLHWFTHGGIGDARLQQPVVPGHEFAGVVDGGPLHGRRVAVDPAIPCGHCEHCRGGHGNLCPQVRFAGHGELDGALREWIAWPTGLLHPLPDNLSDADGAMLEPLGVAVHAFDLGHLRLGGSVAVVGCGPIGLLLVQLARVAGAARVIAVDRLEHRVAAALRLGADEALPDADGVLDGADMDVVFEVAGNDAAVFTAVRAARPGGRVVLVGIPNGDQTTFPAGTARRKGLTLTLSRRMHDVYPRAIDLVRRGLVDVTSLVTHRFTLLESPEAFQTAGARAGIKVLITS